MTLMCGLLSWFGVFARREWWKVPVRSIDNCIVCWPCCWVRCWMLQDMDHMEASWVVYVRVPMFDQPEQSKICVLTVISFGIVMLTVRHDLMVRVSFIWDPGDVLRQTSPDVLSVEGFPLYIYQTWDFTCRSLQCSTANRQTTSDRLTANRGTIGIPCNLKPSAVRYILSRTWITSLVLQVYFRDHLGSFNIPHLDTRSVIMNYHSDFFIGLTLRICSPIGYTSISLPLYQ